MGLRDTLQAITDYPWAFLSLVLALWFLLPYGWFGSVGDYMRARGTGVPSEPDAKPAKGKAGVH